MGMKQKALIVLIGILVIAYGGMSGCGKKLKSDNNNASSGYGGMPSANDTPASVDTTGGSGTGNGGYWHGCKYTQDGVIISCSEMANITSPSSCQGGGYVDSCPTINLVAKCTIRDSYMTLIKINYEYSGTLQDAQQYTILQSGETVSCTSN